MDADAAAIRFFFILMRFRRQRKLPTMHRVMPRLEHPSTPNGKTPISRTTHFDRIRIQSWRISIFSATKQPACHL